MPQSVAAFKKRLNDYNAMGCGSCSCSCCCSCCCSCISSWWLVNVSLSFGISLVQFWNSFQHFVSYHFILCVSVCKCVCYASLKRSLVRSKPIQQTQNTGDKKKDARSYYNLIFVLGEQKPLRQHSL